MIIQNLNYHTMIAPHKPKYGLERNAENECAGLCVKSETKMGKSIKGNNMYNGSFTGKEKAAVSLSERLLDNLIDACNNHTTIVQNLVALVLALGPRPLAIMSLPGKKNKEDKIYASGHSMASGLIGFAFASIVMYPLGQAAKKIRQDAQVIMGKIDRSNDVKLVLRRLKKLSAEENPDLEKLKPENLLEGTSLYDTKPDKYMKKYGVPYDKEFMNELGYLTEDGKLSEHIDLNNIDYDNFHAQYNKNHLTKEKLMEGTKYVKDKFADRFIKNFVDLDKNGQFIKINKKLDFDKVYKFVNMAPDVFVFGVAKAMLTVALIPPILKYVFGLEKSKPASQPKPSILENKSSVSAMNNGLEKFLVKADKANGGEK